MNYGREVRNVRHGWPSLLDPEALASLPQLQGLLTRSRSGLRLKLSLFRSPSSCKRVTRDCQSEAWKEGGKGICWGTWYGMTFRRGHNEQDRGYFFPDEFSGRLENAFFGRHFVPLHSLTAHLISPVSWSYPALLQWPQRALHTPALDLLRCGEETNFLDRPGQTSWADFM